MALPLKTGADLYNQQLIRARLQNLGAQPNTADVGLGQVYFNTGTNTAASLRIGYCYETGSVPKFHHVANLEDVNRLEELIKALSGSSSESVASVLGRVITLEGYFSNGKAKDADLLDGHNSDYFATASGLSALQEKVSAFLDGEADSDAVLENLKEIQAFLDSYDGATSLADMFGAVNTQITDRYTKAEADARYLQLTGGIVANTSNAPLKIKTDSESAWVGIEYLNNLGEREGSIGIYGGKPIFVPAALDKIWTILHTGNYSNLVTDLNNNLNVPSITIGGIKLSVVEGQLQIEGDAFATGQLSSGGIGSEGSGSGASGIVILEDWEKYDDTLAQVLGAGLGVGLRDRVAALESKATNVSVAQTLTSGKEIGAITIDGVATKLFAPSTYAWSEITSKPISLGGYGIIDAVRLLSSQQGNYAIKTHLPAVLVGYTGEEKEGISGDYGILNIPIWSANTESLYYATQIYSVPNATNLCWRQVTASANGAWKVLLDDHNYENLIGNKFLKLSGGTMQSLTGNMCPLYLLGNDTYVALGLSIGKNQPQAYLTYDGSELRYAKPDTSWNTLLHAGNFNTYAPTLTGTGASGTWGIDISGSATKLQTKRRLWGNSFDGTENINGDIHLAADKGIVASNGYAVLTAPSYLLLGYAQSELGQTTYLDGNDIYLRYGKNHVPAMDVNSAGNVTIGDKDYAGSDYKFFVHGEGRVSGGLSCIGLCGTRPTLGSAPSSGFIVDAYGKDTYGLSVWLENSGQSFIQSGRFDGDATAYALNLQPLGGVVSVGGRLLVNGATDDGISTLQVQGAAYIIGGDYASVGGAAVYWGIDKKYMLGSNSATDFYLWSTSTTAALRLGTNNVERIRITVDGMVGIGTPTPQETLHVVGNLRVTGNIIADGQVSSGGVAEEGTGGATGGSGLDRVVFTIPKDSTSFSCEHNLGTREISVTIYEEGNDYQQVLADVYLDSTNIARVVFGSATDVAHKVVIIG